MIALKLERHGDATVVLLPEEALSRLQAKAGDTLYLTEASDGYRLTSSDPSSLEAQMKVARRIMETRRDVLRELAKT